MAPSLAPALVKTFGEFTGVLAEERDRLLRQYKVTPESLIQGSLSPRIVTEAKLTLFATLTDFLEPRLLALIPSSVLLREGQPGGQVCWRLAGHVPLIGAFSVALTLEEAGVVRVGAVLSQARATLILAQPEAFEGVLEIGAEGTFELLLSDDPWSAASEMSYTHAKPTITAGGPESVGAFFERYGTALDSLRVIFKTREKWFDEVDSVSDRLLDLLAGNSAVVFATGFDFDSARAGLFLLRVAGAHCTDGRGTQQGVESGAELFCANATNHQQLMKLLAS